MLLRLSLEKYRRASIVVTAIPHNKRVEFDVRHSPIKAAELLEK